MKHFVMAVVASATVLCTLPARADDNDDLCSYYGNIGASAVDFLMPLTFRQVVDLVAGKDEALAKKLNERLQSRANSRVVAILGRMGDDAAGLLGESAGYQAFQMAIGGQATKGSEIFAAMNNACLELGADTIIENQRQKRSQGQPTE
ncbi:MAG: hypothetical protein EP335_02550 [Alphaproteobacteria bacterium]|nr:MAG: hypothetical protein EP335_02550 [Alphaproteobacteria bacterium]